MTPTGGCFLLDQVMELTLLAQDCHVIFESPFPALAL